MSLPCTSHLRRNFPLEFHPTRRKNIKKGHVCTSGLKNKEENRFPDRIHQVTTYDKIHSANHLELRASVHFHFIFFLLIYKNKKNHLLSTQQFSQLDLSVCQSTHTSNHDCYELNILHSQ